MKEAMFYEKLDDEKVKCNLCPWNCEIASGKRGVCGVRENREGKLYSLSYENIASATPDPIEKKPLFHFAPGSRTYSICTPGCNWKCKYCQNWQLSQGSLGGRSLTPKEIVSSAKKAGTQGISYTYTEPTIFFELAYETAKLASQEGLYNTFVTNGYINPEPIKKIAPYLDAVTVDFKGSGEEKFLKDFAGVPTVDPIYTAIEEYFDQEIHLEITDLIVPRVGDSEEKIEELVQWIAEDLGTEVPVHFLRFYPAHKVKDLPPTDVGKLEKAKKIAEAAGLNHVYLGNVGGESDTVCPSCGEGLIYRSGGRIARINLEDGLCPSCGSKAAIAGTEWMSRS